MCKGGLTLHTFLTNSMAVLHAVDGEGQATKYVDLRHDDHVVEKALGINWCKEFDSF